MIGISSDAGALLRLKIEAAEMDAEIRAAIRKIGREGRAAAIAALSKPGSGRTYKAAGERRTRLFSRARRIPAYTASAPGQPPAKASGNLLASVRMKYPAADKGYGVKVFAKRGDAFYRHFLEFGAGPAKKGKRKGAGGIRAPRPIWSPLQKQFEGRVIAAIEEIVARRTTAAP